MPKLRQGVGLALEARDGLGIVAELPAQHLDGHLAADGALLGAVDGAHAPDADAPGEGVPRAEGDAEERVASGGLKLGRVDEAYAVGLATPRGGRILAAAAGADAHAKPFCAGWRRA